MAKLKEAYTDIKSVRHRVEHLTLPAEDQDHRERMIEELTQILIEAGKSSP